MTPDSALVDIVRRLFSSPPAAVFLVLRPLIAALEALRAAPKNEANLNKVASIFSEMGANQVQGAVLTYAPYIAFLLSDDPFGQD